MAVQRAMDAAAQQGRALYAPAGRYRIDARANTVGRALRLRYSLHLYGDGAGLTVFKAFPDVVEEFNAMFVVHEGHSATFADLSFEGPDDANGGTWSAADGSRTTIGVLHRGQSGALRLLRVSTSRFTHGVKADPGGVTVELRDSDVSALSQGVLHVGAGALHAYNTRFHHTGGLTGEPNAHRDHHLYLSYAVAIEIDNCTFDNNRGFALQIFGGQDDDAVPAYVRVSNSRFGRGQKNGVLSHKNRKTEIINCVFESESSVLLRNDMDITGTRFGGSLPGEIYGAQVQTYIQGSGRLYMDGCAFDGAGRALNISVPGNDWTIRNTAFNNGEHAIFANGGPYAVRVAGNTYNQRGYSIEAAGQGTIHGVRGEFPPAKLDIGIDVIWIEWSGR